MDTGPFTVDELAEAWERVRDNQGRAGVDAVTVEDFDKADEGRLAELAKRVGQRAYRMSAPMRRGLRLFMRTISAALPPRSG